MLTIQLGGLMRTNTPFVYFIDTLPLTTLTQTSVHQTGALTSNLSDAVRSGTIIAARCILISLLLIQPQKVNGLAGVTLGAIVQSIATLVGGTIVGKIILSQWSFALG
jgi:hypothetical protein